MDLVIDGRSVELVGDGMSPNSLEGRWVRDSRETRCFGGFGHLTTKGSTLSAAELEVAVSILSACYSVAGFNPDEEQE